MATNELQHRDLEYHDLERDDLLSGEPRYPSDEIRNSMMAMIFGGIAGVLCLVAMILTWILYFRERTRTFLWHGIWLIFAMLFAFACAGWGAITASAIKQNKQPNSNLTLIIFIGSIIFAIYLLAESFWLVFYRYNHFAYITGLRTDNDLWDRRMTSGSTFEEGWKSSRRMLWWVTFFTAFSGALFACIAYCARSVVWNRFQLTRITLYLVALGMVLSGFLMIYWAEECYEYQKLSAWDFGGKLVEFLKALGIIGVILGVLIAIVNLLRYKWAYFILGLITLIFMALVIVGDGSLWREIRYIQDAKLTTSCQDVLSPIHENSLSNVCINGGKYLPAGQQCNKSYLVNRWEGGSTSEVRSLNPACCQLGTTWYNYPFQLLAFWSLIMAMCALLAAAFCLYLADNSEYLSNAYKQLNAIDFILFALPILLAIAWILYFIIRKKNEIEFGTQGYAKSFINPADNKVEGFDPVPKKVVSAASPVPNANGCFTFETANMVNIAFSNTDATCTSNCVQRVSMMSSDATFTLPSDLAGGNVGGDARKTFFPNCVDPADGYFMIFGTNDQLKNVLNKVMVCPKVIGTYPVIRFRHDQVPQASISSNGLRTGEENPTVVAGVCGAGFTSTDGGVSCAGACNYLYTNKNLFVTRTLKGALFYIQSGATKYSIHPEVKIEASARGVPAIGTATQLTSDGIFLIGSIPRYRDSSYPLTLTISDPKNVFLTKKVDVLIDRDLGVSDELSGGNIRLLTSDGKYCAPADAACIAARPSSTGTIGFNVKDASDPSNVKGTVGANIMISQQHIAGGTSVTSIITDESGNAKTATLPYGAYTATFLKSGFVPTALRLDLQEPNMNAIPVMLAPLTDNYDMRVVANMNEPAADFDLLLGIKSDVGKECTVSPYNKYCPYSSHLSDVKMGIGQEVIGVKQLAVANYMAMVAPSPTYSASCSQDSAVVGALAHYQSWNWDNFKKTRSLENLDISVRTFGGFSQSSVDSSGNTIVVQPKELPVETPEQAAVTKTLIAVGGTALAVADQKKISTNVITTPAATPAAKRVLATTISHKADSTANFLLVSCFTGFGTSSILEVGSYFTSKPTFENCANILKQYRANLTVDNLRKAVDVANK